MYNGGNGKYRYPRWIERLGEDEALKRNVSELSQALRKVAVRQIFYNRSQGEGEKADLEAARDELKDKLEDIFQTGDTEKNPAWEAVMRIRPGMIAAKMNPICAEALYWALRGLSREAEEKKEEDKAVFFGRLSARLRNIAFFRAVISGGVVAIKRDMETEYYYFPPIPISIRQMTEVKLTTHPDNIQAIFKAYRVMEEKTKGKAREAVTAHIATIEQLVATMQPKPKV